LPVVRARHGGGHERATQEKAQAKSCATSDYAGDYGNRDGADGSGPHAGAGKVEVDDPPGNLLFWCVRAPATTLFIMGSGSRYCVTTSRSPGASLISATPARNALLRSAGVPLAIARLSSRQYARTASRSIVGGGPSTSALFSRAARSAFNSAGRPLAHPTSSRRSSIARRRFSIFASTSAVRWFACGSYPVRSLHNAATRA